MTYPNELQLKKTSESPTALLYLDIEVTIVDRKYSTAIYDKRYDLNFRIVNFPHVSSNIPPGPGYGVYISQLICIGRTCTEHSAVRHYRLTERLIHQGYWYSDLCRALCKFVIKHTEIIDKYKVSIHKHVEDGICLPAMNSVLSGHVSRRQMFLNLINNYLTAYFSTFVL